MFPSISLSLISSSTSLIFPLPFLTFIESVTVAIPTESYPLYSSFLIESIIIGAAFLSKTHPTIPHII